MIDWTWTRETVSPGDILDGAQTIPVTEQRVTMNLTERWVPARRYLEWARAALSRGGEDGWDAASTLAKRTVCRQMDGILANNHLGCFQGKNYGVKSEYLTELKVPALGLIRDLVIDPRNDIEHAYGLSTEAQARQALDIAELFIGATAAEAESPAIMALGWNVSIRESISTTPGREHHLLEISLRKELSPMLLISGYPDAPNVTILYPHEQTLRICPLRDFSSSEIIILNTRLRECLKLENYSSRPLGDAFNKALKEQLKL